MYSLLRTTPKSKDFQELTLLLDEELAITDGEDHAFYDQYNKTDHINFAIVLYKDGKPAGCGAIKEFQPGIMEVKRMFTKKEYRGKGYASKILKELETWAIELGYRKCILETGINQPQAIALYKKTGYILIPNYGQYAGIEKSFCFAKELKEPFHG